MIESHFGKLPAACVAVGVFALAARLLVVIHASDFTANFQNESARLGRSLATTGDFSNPYILETSYSAHCAPAHPLILAAIYGVFGFGERGQQAKQLMNSVVSALAVALVPLVAVAVGLPLGSGILGGLLAVVPTGFADVATDWEWPWTQVLIVVLLVSHLRLREQIVGTGAAIGLGLLWGLALHVNPTMILLLGLFAGIDLLESRTRQTLLVAAVAVASLAPWTIRNCQRLGGWIFLRSNPGLELFISTGDDAGPTWATNLERHLKHHPNSSEAAALQVRNEGEIAHFRKLRKEAVAWIQAHPKQYLRLCATRFLYLLFPNDFEGRRYQYPVWMVTVLCLPGFVLMGRSHHGRAVLLLLGTVCLYSIIYVLMSSVNWRYRLPTYPLTTLGAGYCLWWIWQTFQGKIKARSESF